MSEIKSYQRIFIFLLLALLITCLISPWAAALWNLAVQAHPQWEKYHYPFSSMFGRLFMVFGVVLFFLWRRLLKIESFAQLGLQPLRQGLPDITEGFLLAIASMVMLAVVMSFSDVFTPYLRLPFSTGLGRSLKALLQGLTVGFLEEIFFRGILLKGLLEDQKTASALAATSLFYSAIHFVKPAKNFTVSGLDPWAGFRHVLYAFAPFLDPTDLLPGLFGLFLIGAVLGYAFLRTGSLYLSIGLHAGWVFGIKTIRVYGDYRREDLGWLFGSSEPKLVSGVAGWIAILAVGLLIHWITRNRQHLPPKVLSF